MARKERTGWMEEGRQGGREERIEHPNLTLKNTPDDLFTSTP